MACRTDSMHEFNELLARWSEKDKPLFWNEEGLPNLDYDFLFELLKLPISQGDSTQSGRFAKALDFWVAREFEHAGFDEDCIWPRATEPRTLDPTLAKALVPISKKTGIELESLYAGCGSSDAKIMGAVYRKQVDVGISNWMTGPELLVSTKTMGASFGKNLANRFEEAYGDVKNLRERYPLAAHGFVYLLEARALEEPSAFGKAVHMLKQLSKDGDVYDAVALMLVDWESASYDLESGSLIGGACVRFPENVERLIPPELSCEHFFKTLIDKILENASVDAHVEARHLRGVV